MLIPFACDYEREYITTVDFVREYSESINVQFTGVGVFNVSVQLYTDDTFNKILIGGNRRVGERIYGGAIIQDSATHNSNFIIVLKSLWWTNNADANNEVFMPIVVEGCDIEQDNTEFRVHSIKTLNSTKTHSHCQTQRCLRRIYKKDTVTRAHYNKNEVISKALKTLTLNMYLPTQLRFNAKKSLDLISRSRTRITNVCLSTCRTRSVYRAFRLSRIKLRELCLAGKLPGVRKHS
jgi:small subunit ribosomal protein S14